MSEMRIKKLIGTLLTCVGLMLLAWMFLVLYNLHFNPEAPAFSVISGFYDEAFELELTARKGYDIYYTIDGSTPDEESIPYEGPVLIYNRSTEDNIYRSIPNFTYDWFYSDIDTEPVDKAFVVRAIAIGPNGIKSEVKTETFFVGLNDYQDANVLSLVSNPEDLFGPQGIYVTGEEYDSWYTGGQEGDDPDPNFQIHGLECPVSVEFFEAGELILSQNAGVRVQGGSHRDGRFKRLSVIAREEYSGSKFFDEEIFAGKRTHSFVLRDDFEDAFSMTLVSGRDVSYQLSKPVVVFLDGEYWYTVYLEEKYSEAFFEEEYGVSDVQYYKSGTNDEIKTFLSEHDLSNPQDYEAICNIIDIQSYIDCMAANIYLANADWAEYSNIAMWRSTNRENDGYGDGRWRYAMYDLDLCTSLYRGEHDLLDITDAEVNSFVEVRDWSSPVIEWRLFKNLCKNDDFRKQFVISFMDMVNTNFSVPTMAVKLDEWGLDLSYKDYFYVNRAGYITGYMGEIFELTGSLETITIKISDDAAGIVTVNTCNPEFIENSWNGVYFTDYPISVSATANEGYHFVGWQGDISEEASKLSIVIPTGGITVEAVFEKDEP